MSEEFEVSKIKKIRYNLYHVIFNEEIVQKFTDETMATFRVNQGTVFSKETYDEMVKNDQIKRAKSRGLDILSRSSKSKMQIKSTLKREGFCEEAIEHALEFLENYKFVDDQKLATDIAKNKASTKKWSKRQMVSKLMEKGISKNDIEEAQTYIDDDKELENASYHGFKKFKSLSESKPFDERLSKTAQSLGYKGFSYDIIRKVIDEIKKENDN